MTPETQEISGSREIRVPISALNRGSKPLNFISLKSKSSAAGCLEDLPNIGKSIAADLRAIGVHTPAELARRKPVDIYRKLAPVMAKRHDPCVLHTLLAVEHFMKTSESRPWWEFTPQGRRLLSK